MPLLPQMQDPDEYMHWVKTNYQAPWNLVSSGLLPVKWSELDVDPAALEITGANAYGYGPLLERIACRYGARVENVALGVGCSMTNFLVMAALLGPGDRMLVESPAYEPMYRSAQLVGAEVDFFTRRYEEGYKLDPDRVAAALRPNTRLVLLTNLHNPSGAYSDEKTLLAVGQAAARAGARVLADEIYLEFIPNSRSAFLLGENFVVTNSLTKVYGLNGLRCGWLLAEAKVAEACRRVTNFLHGEGVLLAEIASSVAFDRMDWLAERTRRLLAANRPLVDKFMEDHRGQIEWAPPVTGSICFPRLKKGTGAALAKVAGEKYETGIVAGEFFDAPRGAGQCAAHFRLGFGNTTDVVREGLARLSKALAEI
jgi:hypothetical protein